MAEAKEDAAAEVIETEAETEKEKEHQELKEATEAAMAAAKELPKEAVTEPEMADVTEAMVAINLLVIDQVAKEDVEEIS
jgi:hypothetical protein